MAIVDAASEPKVVQGKRAKDCVLVLRLYGGDATVGKKGHRLTWSPSVAEFSEVPGLRAERPERLFRWGYDFTLVDACIEVLAVVTRDLIRIEQSNAQRREKTEFADLSARVDRNIGRLAELGSTTTMRISATQQKFAMRRAQELLVMSTTARSRS